MAASAYRMKTKWNKNEKDNCLLVETKDKFLRPVLTLLVRIDYIVLSRFGAFLKSSLIFAKKCAFLKTICTNSTTQQITCKNL